MLLIDILRFKVLLLNILGFIKFLFAPVSIKILIVVLVGQTLHSIYGKKSNPLCLRL